MKFGFIGLSYRDADLSIRDKVFFSDSKKMDFLDKLVPMQIEQCMILSTCNRSEVFYFYENEASRKQIFHLFLSCFPEVNLASLIREKEGEDAMEYLFRVTCGMESQVIGEDQILGQVKDALLFSQTMGYSGKELNKVVRESITCAKKIKTDLKVSEIPLSVCYVGICQLNALCNIKGKRILIAGSGKTAALALTYVKEYQAGEVTICSRSLSHARSLAGDDSGVKSVLFEKRYEVIANCDIVISATSSPHLVFQRDKMPPVSHVWMLDLASPRDIDEQLLEEDAYDLINLDSLMDVFKEHEEKRKILLQQGQVYIQDALEETLSWLHASRVDGTIESLQKRCEEIELDSMEYLNRKMELTKREKKILQKTLHAALHRLMREPIEEMKQLESVEKQEQYKQVVSNLFHI